MPLPRKRVSADNVLPRAVKLTFFIPIPWILHQIPVFQFLCAHQPDAAPRFYSILYSNDRKGHRRAATIMPDRSTAKYSLQISSTRIVSVNEARTSYASSVRSEGGTLDREPFSFFRLKRLQSAKVIKRPLNRCESTETRFGAENIFCPTDRLEQDFNANVKDTPKV